MIATLPTFMSPRIIHAQPLWRARVANTLHTVEVSASTRIEAKFKGAQQLGANVQVVVVEEIVDPALERLNRWA